VSLRGARSPRYRERPPEAGLLFPSRVGPDRHVEGGERDTLDAYWTPQACAVACCQAIRDAAGPAGWLPEIAPRRVLEPSVGGGSWVRAAWETWPTIRHVEAIDLDPESPGLELATESRVADFLLHYPPHIRFPPIDLILGNPPYSGDLLGWLDRSVQLGTAVAYLLRSTVLGSIERSAWWAANRPATIWTLAPRPRWQGPGGRAESDTCDSVLVLWVAGFDDTRHRWLRWEPR
jgi:hypothetical protein